MARFAPVLALLCAACLGDVEIPPDPPELFPVDTPTGRLSQTLRGAKPVGTAVLNFDEVVYAHDAGTAWEFELALRPGDNRVELRTERKSGKRSVDSVTATIVHEPPCPGAPTVAPVTSPTADDRQVLTGTKPAGAAIEINGAEVTPPGPETEWTHAADLASGANELAVVARDAKDRRSAPVRVVIVVDTSPPAALLDTRFPPPDATDVPVNSRVGLGFDGPLQVADRDGALTVEGVDGGVSYSVGSDALIFQPVLLRPDTEYRVAVHPETFTDAAGNQADEEAGAAWAWSFTTGGDTDIDAPAAPTVATPPATTTATEVTLAGGRPAWTATTINGREVAAVAGGERWSADWPLVVGENVIEVRAVDMAGLVSEPAVVSVSRQAAVPSPPALTTDPPEEQAEALLELEGTKDPGAAVLADGVEIVCATEDTAWIGELELAPGANDVELRARAPDGALSEPIVVSVVRTQGYEGLVPAGWQLLASFAFRDLARIEPIRSTFETGDNKYGIDAWIEGPYEDEGGACVFDDSAGERGDLRFLTTLTHYQGTKIKHENPFGDEDYRAPDYLAALIEGGVLASLGLSPGSTRRERNGRTRESIGAALTLESVAAIDESCYDRFITHIDGCTSATRDPGPVTLRWPALDTQGGRVRQGEYLLSVLLHLDRDPTWVEVHDLETCHADPAHAQRGQHRFVRRVGLGGTEWTLTLPQSAELSAPDPEAGAGRLHYLTDAGITLRWGPSN